MDIDLDAYFGRIGYRGNGAPTLATLADIHRLHPAAIAFENLEPFTGGCVSLTMDDLQAKLVRGGRGGFCYEQNLLLMEVLRALGFTVKGLAARVVWNRPADALTPRSHMLLAVPLDGETWLMDVGFGGLTQTGPLRLAPGVEQQTPHEPFRLVDEAGAYLVQAHAAGEWRNLYRFDLAEHFAIDYEVSSFFLCRHPASHFIANLMAARALPDRRLALMNNRYAIHHRDGRTERNEIASADELADLLERDFGLSLPDRSAFTETARAKIFPSAG
ncbi:MAG: arylamine N-acetyltransferase [Rhizobiaceae bacterium]|nr:arylamine N-acetyltransferase [Rhizobiaceae bacterium]